MIPVYDLSKALKDRETIFSHKYTCSFRKEKVENGYVLSMALGEEPTIVEMHELPNLGFGC